MSERFKDDARFSLAFQSVRQLGGENDADIDVIDNEADIVYKMLSLAKTSGLDISSSQYLVRPFGMVCYAAKNDSFTIDCDGTVMKCTVHIDDPQNKIGIISDEGLLLVKDHLMSWWTSKELPHRCNTCKVLPICYGKKCPAVNLSNEACDTLVALHETMLKALYVQ